MNTAELIPYMIILFFAGMVIFYFGFINLKRKRQIENIPTSKIRSLAVGMAEVYGKAASIKMSSLAPFTGKPCVYYKMLIEEYKQHGKNKTWVTIRADECKEPFYIIDDTGSVIVDPQNAALELPVDYQTESGFGKDPPKEVQKYLSETNLNFEGFLGANKKMRFTEYRIETGENVYVMGTATLKSEGRYSEKNEDNLMITKGGKYDFYYISDRPEKEVLKSFGRKIFWGVYGGGALMLISIAIIVGSVVV